MIVAAEDPASVDITRLMFDRLIIELSIIAILVVGALLGVGFLIG